MHITTDTMQALVDAYARAEQGIEYVREWLEAKEAGGESPDADAREAIRDAREQLDNEMESDLEPAIAELAALLPKPPRKARKGARTLSSQLNPARKLALNIRAGDPFHGVWGGSLRSGLVETVGHTGKGGESVMIRFQYGALGEVPTSYLHRSRDNTRWETR